MQGKQDAPMDRGDVPRPHPFQHRAPFPVRRLALDPTEWHLRGDGTVEHNQRRDCSMDTAQRAHLLESGACGPSVRPRLLRIAKRIARFSLVFPCTLVPLAPACAQEKPWWFTHHADTIMFGHTILPTEDEDGDGAEDLIVTAPLAYTAGGRTGCVLVLSSGTGKLLRRVDGEPRRERFGIDMAVVARDELGRAAAVALTTVAYTARSDRPLRVEETYSTSVYSVPSWELRFRLDGQLHLPGSPGDIDGDAIPDILLSVTGEACETRWHSTKDGRRIDRPSPTCGVRLLAEDYDGDGVRDALALDPLSDRSARIVSTRSQDVIGTIKFEHAPPIPFRSAIAGPGLLHGKRPLLVDMSRTSDATSKLVMYSWKGGGLPYLRASEPEPGAHNREYEYSLHVVPDIDADGCEDLITLCARWGAPHVSAWSGRSLTRLWRVEGIVEEGSTALAVIRQPQDPHMPVALAVGGACFIPRWRDMEFIGRSEPICMVDPKTGDVLRRFHERDYGELWPLRGDSKSSPKRPGDGK